MRSRKCRVLSVAFLALLTWGIGVIAVKNMYQAESVAASGIKWGDGIPLSEIGADTAEEKFIKFQVLDGETLIIGSHKMYDYYDARWELAEVDAIMNSLQGTWQADQYMGFISSHIFYSELDERFGNQPEYVREEYRERYRQHVQYAQEHLPDYLISIRDDDFTAYPKNNYIYVNGSYPSAVNILFHWKGFNEIYTPGLYEAVCITSDFHVEYPVLYLQFYIYEKEDEIGRYRPATLVVTADKQFLVQLDGAFYSLKQVDTDTLR